MTRKIERNEVLEILYGSIGRLIKGNQFLINAKVQIRMNYIKCELEYISLKNIKSQ